LGLRASHSRSLASRRGQCNGRRPIDVFAAYGLRPREFAHARCEANPRVSTARSRVRACSRSNRGRSNYELARRLRWTIESAPTITSSSAVTTRKTPVPTNAARFMSSCQRGQVPASVSQVGNPTRIATADTTSNATEIRRSCRARTHVRGRPSRWRAQSEAPRRGARSLSRAKSFAQTFAHRSRPELTLDDRKCGFWGHRIWQRTAHKAGGRGFKPLAVGSRPEQLLRTSQAS